MEKVDPSNGEEPLFFCSIFFQRMEFALISDSAYSYIFKSFIIRCRNYNNKWKKKNEKKKLLKTTLLHRPKIPLTLILKTDTIHFLRCHVWLCLGFFNPKWLNLIFFSPRSFLLDRVRNALPSNRRKERKSAQIKESFVAGFDALPPTPLSASCVFSLKRQFGIDALLKLPDFAQHLTVLFHHTGCFLQISVGLEWLVVRQTHVVVDDLPFVNTEAIAM